ncbi:hypothetical protein FQR65_LT19899 [Abscondita terminalis]|nr:hypothetical protein FQR65_LT19899 [Abscondita terminalis]
MNDLADFEAKINEKTKLVWIETPTNPLMKLADIEAIAKITKKHGVLFAVDNTFATPYLQKPLDLGADIVMHSATKYLGGHSDVIAGALVIKEESVGKQLHLHQLPPSYIRSTGKLLVAQKVAEFLEQHPLMTKYCMPGLASHPHNELAKNNERRIRRGMVSFYFLNPCQKQMLFLLRKA